MIRTCVPLVAAVSLLTLFADQSSGQVAFGVVQQNGAVTGGGLMIGGSVINGGTGVRLGISTGVSNLSALNTFSFMTAATRQNRGPTPQQFVQAAGRFDRDHDGRLDRKELAQVGSAVIAELRRRQGRNTQTVASHGHPNFSPNADSTAPTTDKMVEAFVTRCMTFDADGDDALNAGETTRMAAALIRSLS